MADATFCVSKDIKLVYLSSVFVVPLNKSFARKSWQPFKKYLYLSCRSTRHIISTRGARPWPEIRLFTMLPLVTASFLSHHFWIEVTRVFLWNDCLNDREALKKTNIKSILHSFHCSLRYCKVWMLLAFNRLSVLFVWYKIFPWKVNNE